MPTIKLDIDPESFRHLTDLAIEARRPIPWQAEVLLIRVLARSAKKRAQDAKPHSEAGLVTTGKPA